MANLTDAEAMAPDSRLIVEQPGVAGAARAFRRRLGQGELGNLPVLLGIFVIWTVFQFLNSRFLSPVNLTNLVLQIAAMGTISVGIVLVLLLGEIDLSVGAVSGLTAAIMAVLNVKHGWSAPAAIMQIPSTYQRWRRSRWQPPAFRSPSMATALLPAPAEAPTFLKRKAC